MIEAFISSRPMFIPIYVFDFVIHVGLNNVLDHFELQIYSNVPKRVQRSPRRERETEREQSTNEQTPQVEKHDRA